MLQRQNGSWDQHSHLFGVGDRLKRCSYSHFCFAKTYVAANQAVHWPRSFHVAFDVLGCFVLIWGIFKHERRFEFILKIAIWSERKSGFAASLGVKLDEVKREFFDFLFGLVL